MKNLSYIAAALALICLFTNCSNSRVEADNKALQSYPAGSKAFKEVLAAQLAATPADFTCTFDKYAVKNGQEYLTVTIKRGGFKSTEEIAVKNWNKLAGVQKTKGMGYAGAELKGLRLATAQIGDQTALMYQDVEQIVD